MVQSAGVRERVMASRLEQQLSTLRQGDHACSFYQTAAEQMAVVVPFVKEGLARGEGCVYIADDRTVEEVTEALLTAGADVGREQKCGALLFSCKWDWRNSGEFDIDMMAAGVKTLVDQALAPGLPGLWVAVEMTWTLEPDIDPRTLAQWESHWNELIAGMPVVLLCQYNRQRITPAAIRWELRTHPLVICNDQVYPNLYYEPPDLFLDPEAYEQRVEWMLAQLQRVRLAEEERFRALIEHSYDALSV